MKNLVLVFVILLVPFVNALAQNPPNAPTNAQAVAVNDRITVTWTDNSPNEYGFYVYRCQGAGCTDFVHAYTKVANSTTLVDTELQPDTHHRYIVFAVSAVDLSLSAPSNIAEATTLQPNEEPRITIVSPLPGSTVKKGKVKIEAVTLDGPESAPTCVAFVELRVNNQLVASEQCVTSIEHEINASKLMSPTWVSVLAMDSVGAYTVEQWMFFVQ